MLRSSRIWIVAILAVVTLSVWFRLDRVAMRLFHGDPGITQDVSGPRRVLVGLDDTACGNGIPPSEPYRACIRNLMDSVLARMRTDGLNIRSGQQFETIPALDLWLTREEMDIVRAYPEVKRVTEQVSVPPSAPL